MRPDSIALERNASHVNLVVRTTLNSGKGDLVREVSRPNQTAWMRLSFQSNPTKGRAPAPGFANYTYVVDDYNRYFLNQLMSC